MSTHYLRIGEWDRTNPRPRSRNYATGEIEVGLSVYDLDEVGNPIAPPDSEWAEDDLRDRIKSADPKFIVTGQLVGIGHDGEPLLSDIVVVGEWDGLR